MALLFSVSCRIVLFLTLVALCWSWSSQVADDTVRLVAAGHPSLRSSQPGLSGIGFWIPIAALGFAIAPSASSGDHHSCRLILAPSLSLTSVSRSRVSVSWGFDSCTSRCVADLLPCHRRRLVRRLPLLSFSLSWLRAGVRVSGFSGGRVRWRR